MAGSHLCTHSHSHIAKLIVIVVSGYFAECCSQAARFVYISNVEHLVSCQNTSNISVAVSRCEVVNNLIAYNKTNRKIYSVSLTNIAICH